MILENENYSSKIIFPDHKFSLDLHIGTDNYTLKNLLDDSQSQMTKEAVWSVVFLDSDGEIIANSVNASILTRMNFFRINVNGGERIYNCVNFKYLANNRIDKNIKVFENIDFDRITDLMNKYNLSFVTAEKLVELETSTNETSLTFKALFKDYLKFKYHAVAEFNNHINEKRERRIQKFLNFFFYASFAQVLALNLCTFVFFNWDVMEPITQCISYINLIAGYYFWALTNTDYELDSMVKWLRQKRLFFRKTGDSQLLEEEDIRRVLNNKI